MSHEAIVQLIAATTTASGLRVRAKLDRRTYPTGLTVSKAEFASLRLVAEDFHGEWNYALHPRDHE